MNETLVAPQKTETRRIVLDMEQEDRRVRFTRAMCRLLDEGGLLPERYELLEGVIYTKMPIHAPHRIVVLLLKQWFDLLFRALFVQTEDAIVIPGVDGETNEPEPDVAITLQPTTAYNTDNPPAEEVRLAVEVADSTLGRDLNVKSGIYARAGIPEYWVFDIAGRQVHRHRVPENGRYTEILILGENDNLTLLDRTETIRVRELLPPVPEAQATE